jgi:hypothetical protein
MQIEIIVTNYKLELEMATDFKNGSEIWYKKIPTFNSLNIFLNENLYIVSNDRHHNEKFIKIIDDVLSDYLQKIINIDTLLSIENTLYDLFDVGFQTNVIKTDIDFKNNQFLYSKYDYFQIPKEFLFDEYKKAGRIYINNEL